jgi:hypothetical protein
VRNHPDQDPGPKRPLISAMPRGSGVSVVTGRYNGVNVALVVVLAENARPRGETGIEGMASTFVGISSPVTRNI